MQFKPVPAPPGSIDALAAVVEALPPEADPDVDCCARVIERTDVETRDDAAEWITFCRALGLVVEEADGYRREPPAGASSDTEPLGRAQLASTFRERVVGADEVLRALEHVDDPLSPAELVERLEARDGIPDSERRRHGERLAAVWTDRVERILEWATLFDAAERVEGGYRLA